MSTDYRAAVADAKALDDEMARTAAELNDAVARGADPVEAAAILDQIEDGRDRLAERLAAIQASTTARAAIGRIDAAILDISRRVRSWHEDLAAEVRPVMADPRYSDEFKRDQREAILAEAQENAERVARAAWATYTQARRAVEADLVTANREASAQFDLAQVGGLVQDYAAQLGAPPVAASMEGAGADQLRFVRTLHGRAADSANPNQLRAWRIAAAPVVNAALAATAAGTPLGAEARDLARLVRDQLHAERGRVPELELIREAVEARGEQLRGAILAYESAATGDRRDVFRPVTPWAAAILGERVEDYSGGVSMDRFEV